MTKAKHYLFFDLDGTLTNSAPGITKAVSYALSSLHYPLPDQAGLERYVGPPLTEGFMDLAGMNESEATRAVVLYRQYYASKGLFDNAPYPGIESLLATLSARGVRLYVTTSKPVKYAKVILAHFGLLSFFRGVYGPTLDEKLSLKKDIVAHAFRATRSRDKEKALIIGDRFYDIDGARENGIEACGVGYGFGGEEEFKDATWYAATVTDLGTLLARIAR